MSTSCSTSNRFTGTIECLGEVDATETPSVIAGELVRQFYPECKFAYGLWAMEPGQVHPAHVDQQPPEWIARIHVPLQTNADVIFTMDDGDHRLEMGKAYRVNTLRTHAVSNNGATERVHLVVEVMR